MLQPLSKGVMLSVHIPVEMLAQILTTFIPDERTADGNICFDVFADTDESFQYLLALITKSHFDEHQKKIASNQLALL